MHCQLATLPRLHDRWISPVCKRNGAQRRQRFGRCRTLRNVVFGVSLQSRGGAAGSIDVAADLPRLATMRGLLAEFDSVASRAAAVPGWAGLASVREPIASLCGIAEEI